MSRYDGLIIPRSYSEYINKTDAATLLQALQLSGVMDNAPTANSNHPVKSSGLVPVNEVTNNDMRSVTSNAVANKLDAMNTSYGLKIGNYHIENIEITITPTWQAIGAVYRSSNGGEVYNFTAPFTQPPIVILNTEGADDYVYCAIIGIIRDKTQIKRIVLLRETQVPGDVTIKGIAIGI